MIHFTQGQFWALVFVLSSAWFSGGFLSGSAWGHNRALRQVYDHLKREQAKKAAKKARAMNGQQDQFLRLTPAEFEARRQGHVAPMSVPLAEVARRNDAMRGWQ